MRHGLLGRGAQAVANNPHRPAARCRTCRSASRPSRRRKAIGAKTPARARLYRRARRMYVDYDKIDHRSRVQSYLKAMEALAGHYPDDDEAQICYALTLNVAASPADKTYANQLKGGGDPGAIFKRQPQHPGVAHYLIHLLRLSADRGEGPRRGDALFQDRAGGAARPAHAVAHLHARRLLEGIDRLQRRLGARRQGGQGSTATSCMARTTWSMPICSSRRTRTRAP